MMTQSVETSCQISPSFVINEASSSVLLYLEKGKEVGGILTVKTTIRNFQFDDLSAQHLKKTLTCTDRLAWQASASRALLAPAVLQDP